MCQRKNQWILIAVILLLAIGAAFVQSRQPQESYAPLCPVEEEVFRAPFWAKAAAALCGIDLEDPSHNAVRWIPGFRTAEPAFAQPDPTSAPSRIRFYPAETARAEFSLAEPTAEPVDLPEILIYHTHTHEAYNPLNGTAYTEKTGSYRTTDEEFNIVKVGETLAELLREEGFTVYHDRSDYEMPKLSGAYDRSLAGVESFRKTHPEVTVFIDVHRDAYTRGRVMSAEVDGISCAQIMFVVGSGESTGFKDLPDLASNKALAQETMDALSQISPDLVRRMSNKTGRYNQHLSSSCMLIEVGHNLNTLEEALASLPHLARALAQSLADA